MKQSRRRRKTNSKIQYEFYLNNQIEKKDGGSQKYTYDFDGKIILARAVKIDKLQPTNQKLKVELKEQTKPETVQVSTKKGGKRDSARALKPQCPEQEIPNRV